MVSLFFDCFRSNVDNYYLGTFSNKDVAFDIYLKSVNACSNSVFTISDAGNGYFDVIETESSLNLVDERENVYSSVIGQLHFMDFELDKIVNFDE